MFSRKSKTKSTPSTPIQSTPILDPLVPITPPEGYPFHGMDDSQRALFTKLQEHVNTTFEKTLTGVPLPGEKEWADDIMLMKYLRGAKFDIDRACAMITKTLQWRRDYRPTEITPQEIEEESKNGKCFFNGFDKLGRPIFIVNSAICYSTDPERHLRYILFNIENAPRNLCPFGVHQICAIADVKGVSMFNSNPLSVTTRL
ncbi:hypothetical protein HDU98_005517, partial [Podochytrium sp. JEL0797]